MEAMRILGELAAVLAFATAALGVPALVSHARMVRSARRAHDAALSGDGPIARLLRNGIAPAAACARWLSRNARLRSYFDDMRWLAQSRGYASSPETAGGVVLTLAVAAFPVGWILSTSVLFGLMAALCLVMGLGMVAGQSRERHREMMREDVPDVLHAMSACFHAGYSLLQAFHQIAQEAKGPLHDLFLRAESDLKTGCTASETLQRMRTDSELSELTFITAALEIQHQTGGSLQQIIDSARDSIEGELALRRSLRVQTAQARLSMRVVTVMPFVLIALFSFISPEFLSPFFASPLGLAVFAFALGMQGAGVLCVRRLLDVGDD